MSEPDEKSIDWLEVKYFVSSGEAGDNMQIHFNRENCEETENAYMDLFKADGTYIECLKFTEAGYIRDF